MGNHLHLDVAITGATGLLGRPLVTSLRASGHRVRVLVRRREDVGTDAVFWDPQRREIDAAALEGIDAVVHLAGENIGEGRWTDERKKLIVQSRVDGTRLIASTIAGLSKKPRVMISASAIGAYGNRGDEWLDESSHLGSGFLADVVHAWEIAAHAARDADIRVVHPRTGIVLSKEGGALAKLLLPFRMGAGGRMGNGQQFMSWVTLQDTIRAFEFALTSESLVGPVNVVAPNPVTNAEFSETLGSVMHRPSLIAAPAFALKLALGEMAQPLLLDGARIRPKQLLEAGFRFLHPTLEDALRAIL